MYIYRNYRKVGWVPVFWTTPYTLYFEITFDLTTNAVTLCSIASNLKLRDGNITRVNCANNRGLPNFFWPTAIAYLVKKTGAAPGRTSSPVSTSLIDRFRRAYNPGVLTKPPRATQPPTLSGTGNEYRAKGGDLPPQTASGSDQPFPTMHWTNTQSDTQPIDGYRESLTTIGRI